MKERKTIAKKNPKRLGLIHTFLCIQRLGVLPARSIVLKIWKWAGCL